MKITEFEFDPKTYMLLIGPCWHGFFWHKKENYWRVGLGYAILTFFTYDYESQYTNVLAMLRLASPNERLFDQISKAVQTQKT